MAFSAAYLKSNLLSGIRKIEPKVYFFSIKGDSLLERVYTKGWRGHKVSTESLSPLIISSLSNSLSFQQPWPKLQPRNRSLSLSWLLYSSMAKAPSISFSSLLSFSISFNIFLVVLAGGGWRWFWAGLWVVGCVVACGLLDFCYQPAVGWWSWWIWVAVSGGARKYFQEG